MKNLAFVSLLSISISSIFYLLDRYGFEEFGGLSHISAAGLIVFIPFFKSTYTNKCVFWSLVYSIIAFMPILLVKFDIITLFDIIIYILFLTFIICTKLKRREVEAGN